MDDDLRRRYQFFAEHAGYCTPPGRAACALSLARAERDAEFHGLEFEWTGCEEAWDGDCPAPTYLVDCVCKDADGKPLAALCSIGLNRLNDPYCRVVEAELASEALCEMAEREGAAVLSL